MDSRKEWMWLRRLLSVAVFLIILYLMSLLKPIWLTVFHVASTVLLPFFVAAFIAYLLHPIIDALHKRRVPRSLSILLVYILFFGGGALLIWYYSPIIYLQTERFISQLPDYFNQLYMFYHNLHRQIDHLPPTVHDSIEATFQQAEANITASLDQLISKWRNFVDMIVLVLLLPFLVFYLLKDFKAIEKLVKRVTPLKWRDEGEILAGAVDEALGDYIRGQFMVAGAVGMISIIALWVIDIPNAVVLGIFIGVTDIIPYFGPILGAIPAIVVAASVSTGKLVTTIIILFVIQQIEGNFLSPYVVGRNVHLHPLVIVFALLLGFEVAGFLGLLLAVPVFVVINNIFHTFKKRKFTWKEGLEERK